MAIFAFITDPINEFRAMRLGRRAVEAFRAGDYGTCEELNRKALAIMERTFGNIEQTAVYTANLAAVFRAQGRLSEAAPFYERSLVIWEKKLGAEHPQVATSLNNLAMLYQAQGRYAEAEPLYKRSLAIGEKALGPEHPNVAGSLENYSALLRETGRGSEAVKLEARARAIRAKHAKENPAN